MQQTEFVSNDACAFAADTGRGLCALQYGAIADARMTRSAGSTWRRPGWAAGSAPPFFFKQAFPLIAGHDRLDEARQPSRAGAWPLELR